jgi:hypothetical protein
LCRTWKTKRLIVRLTADEHERFARLCAERKITVAEGMRRLVREAAGFGPMLDGETRNDIRGLIVEINAIGGALNQAARAMSAWSAPDARTLKDRLQVIEETFDLFESMFSSICAPRRARALKGVETPSAPS